MLNINTLIVLALNIAEIYSYAKKCRNSTIQDFFTIRLKEYLLNRIFQGNLV